VTDRVCHQETQMLGGVLHLRVVRRYRDRLADQEGGRQVLGVEGPDVPLDGLGDAVGLAADLEHADAVEESGVP
jgi:hypothetical protein